MLAPFEQEQSQMPPQVMHDLITTLPIAAQALQPLDAFVDTAIHL